MVRWRAAHAKTGVLPLILAALRRLLRAHSAEAARIASAASMSPTRPFEADRRRYVSVPRAPTRREDQPQGSPYKGHRNTCSPKVPPQLCITRTQWQAATGLPAPTLDALVALPVIPPVKVRRR